MNIFESVIGFQWDAGNEKKNEEKHNVTKDEIERIFFNVPLFCYPDRKHSGEEERINAYGSTDAGRLLHITFCFRENKIRVISARDMHKKERRSYESATKRTTNI